MGRGGWSIYTGAAGWYYRAWIHHAFGIQKRGDRLWIEPRLPAHLSGYAARIQMEGTDIDLIVKRGKEKILTVDGHRVEAIVLDGKRHRAECLLPKAGAEAEKGGGIPLQDVL